MLSFGPAEVGTDYLALCAEFEPEPLEPVDVAPDDLATVVYTGGTTGKPKGVVMPHRVWACMTMIQIAEWEFPDPLRMLIATPLSHAAMSLLAPVVVKGGSFTVMDAFDPDEFLGIIEREEITATMIVPVMLYAIQACSSYETADVSSLQTVFYGASPMSPAKLEAAITRWGSRFFQFYGQTEAPMVAAHLKKAEHDLSRPLRLSSCGRPTPWIKLALLDEQGHSVAHGEVGEICIRGPLVMAGYKDLPDETASALMGDWLHTGDVGRFDEDGFLYIVDRTKDMIISGGFNVFPREVEDVLSAHPAVSVAMVIGVPDDKWGEAVKAVVVLRPGFEPSDDLTAELKALVKEAKGATHSPKTIDYATEIPLTPVGKPDKKQLRATYWQATERAVDEVWARLAHRNISIRPRAVSSRPLRVANYRVLVRCRQREGRRCADSFGAQSLRCWWLAPPAAVPATMPRRARAPPRRTSLQPAVADGRCCSTTWPIRTSSRS